MHVQIILLFLINKNLLRPVHWIDHRIEESLMEKSFACVSVVAF